MMTIVIQAGGQSQRMGRDKALLPFLGQPLIARVIERVSHIADELLVTTNTPDDYRFLNLPLIPDIFPGKGALGGLYTAIDAAHYPLVAVVACDMPFANPQILLALRDELIAKNADVAVPGSADGVEPFHAIYRKDTCLPPILSALDSGKLRIISWFPDVKVVKMDFEEVSRFDPDQSAFTNVNTEEEFHLAEQKALKDHPS